MITAPPPTKGGGWRPQHWSRPPQQTPEDEDSGHAVPSLRCCLPAPVVPIPHVMGLLAQPRTESVPQFPPYSPPTWISAPGDCPPAHALPPPEPLLSAPSGLVPKAGWAPLVSRPHIQLRSASFRRVMDRAPSPEQTPHTLATMVTKSLSVFSSAPASVLWAASSTLRR